jgi:hypothetical protein
VRLRSFKGIDLAYIPMKLRLGGHLQDLPAKKKLLPEFLPSRSHQPQAPRAQTVCGGLHHLLKYSITNPLSSIVLCGRTELFAAI